MAMTDRQQLADLLNRVLKDRGFVLYGSAALHTEIDFTLGQHYAAQSAGREQEARPCCFADPADLDDASSAFDVSRERAGYFTHPLYIAPPSAPASVPVSDAVRARDQKVSMQAAIGEALRYTAQDGSDYSSGWKACAEYIHRRTALAGSAGEPSVEDWRQAIVGAWPEKLSGEAFADAIEAGARELAKGRKPA